MLGLRRGTACVGKAYLVVLARPVIEVDEHHALVGVYGLNGGDTPVEVVLAVQVEALPEVLADLVVL